MAREAIATQYAGDTAVNYRLLSEAGFAPEVICVTDREIVAVKHETLCEWLAKSPSPEEQQAMKTAIYDLLRDLHRALQICHCDAHVENFVVRDGRPLLIDPAYATRSVNEHCYDLVGPQISGVAVPPDHLKQGGKSAHGIWWGSPETTRGLENAFGPYGPAVRPDLRGLPRERPA